MKHQGGDDRAESLAGVFQCCPVFQSPSPRPYLKAGQSDGCEIRGKQTARLTARHAPVGNVSPVRGVFCGFAILVQDESAYLANREAVTGIADQKEKAGTSPAENIRTHAPSGGAGQRDFDPLRRAFQMVVNVNEFTVLALRGGGDKEIIQTH